MGCPKDCSKVNQKGCDQPQTGWRLVNSKVYPQTGRPMVKSMDCQTGCSKVKNLDCSKGCSKVNSMDCSMVNSTEN